MLSPKGIATIQNDTLVPFSPQEFSLTNSDLGQRNSRNISDEIVALAMLGAVAFPGAYNVSQTQRADATPIVQKIAAPTTNLSKLVFGIPVAGPVPNLFSNLDSDEALDSYYKNASFFDSADFSDA
jgi:hypothetical protein